MRLLLVCSFVFSWRINGSGNLLTQDMILRALTSLKCLEEFSLFVTAPFFRLQLQSISSNLSHISIVAPRYVFERLSVDISELVARNRSLQSLRLENIPFYPNGDAATMMDFSTFVRDMCPITTLQLCGWSISMDREHIHRYFHPLSTLHLQGVDSALWPSLQSAQIYISDLRNVNIDKALLDYLASYSGLVKLSLTDWHHEPLAEIDGFAQFFYEQVVVRHSDTLQDLHIETWRHRQWGFSEAHSTSISQCARLHRLSIVLDDLASMFETTVRTSLF